MILSDPTSKQGRDISIHRWETVKQPLTVWRKRCWYPHSHHFLSVSLQGLYQRDEHPGTSVPLTLAIAHKDPGDISTHGQLNRVTSSTHPFWYRLSLLQVILLKTVILLPHTQLGKLPSKTDPTPFPPERGFSRKVGFPHYVKRHTSLGRKRCRKWTRQYVWYQI